MKSYVNMNIFKKIFITQNNADKGHVRVWKGVNDTELKSQVQTTRLNHLIYPNQLIINSNYAPVQKTEQVILTNLAFRYVCDKLCM